MPKKKAAQSVSSHASANKAALIGFLFSIPFWFVNFIVALKIDPFYGWLETMPFLRSTPVLPLILLMLFPIGAFISIRPLLKKGAKTKNLMLNIAVSLIMFAVFLLLANILGSEFLNCEILAIPNCD